LSVSVCHSCGSRNPVISHKYNLPPIIENIQNNLVSSMIATNQLFSWFVGILGHDIFIKNADTFRE